MTAPLSYLDLTLPTPQENIAHDELLLDAAERGESDEILRLWESPETFVVVGYGNKIEAEVNVAACAAKNIPILRRCSGGGTVLQGPGCLSYALILKTARHAELQSITGANRFIMERNRRAIAQEFEQRNLNHEIAVQGHTDLTIDGRKFSGNAQRRRHNFILFHGTLLLDFNLTTVGNFLRQPSRQPGYRKNREHKEFITNLPLNSAAAKGALRSAWCL